MLTLPVGIGANTAIFSVVNAVMLKTPVVDPDRVVQVRERNLSSDWRLAYHVSPSFFSEFRDTNEVFERIATIGFRIPTLLLNDGDARRVARKLSVSADLVPILGVEPAIGRVFRGDEDEPMPEPAVIISHAFWQSEFGGAPDVLGRTLPVYIPRLGRDQNLELLRRVGATEDETGITWPFPAVGVLPPDFELPPVSPRSTEVKLLAADVFLPLGFPGLLNWGPRAGQVLGLLKAGVTREQAQANMDLVAARLREDLPDH